jgi:hypothetical protein
MQNTVAAATRSDASFGTAHGHCPSLTVETVVQRHNAHLQTRLRVSHSPIRPPPSFNSSHSQYAPTCSCPHRHPVPFPPPLSSSSTPNAQTPPACTPLATTTLTRNVTQRHRRTNMQKAARSHKIATLTETHASMHAPTMTCTQTKDAAHKTRDSPTQAQIVLHDASTRADMHILAATSHIRHAQLSVSQPHSQHRRCRLSPSTILASVPMPTCKPMASSHGSTTQTEGYLATWPRGNEAQTRSGIGEATNTHVQPHLGDMCMLTRYHDARSRSRQPRHHASESTTRQSAAAPMTMPGNRAPISLEASFFGTTSPEPHAATAPKKQHLQSPETDQSAASSDLLSSSSCYNFPPPATVAEDTVLVHMPLTRHIPAPRPMLSSPLMRHPCPLIVPVRSVDGSDSFPVSSLLPSCYITSIIQLRTDDRS